MLGGSLTWRVRLPSFVILTSIMYPVERFVTEDTSFSPGYCRLSHSFVTWRTLSTGTSLRAFLVHTLGFSVDPECPGRFFFVTFLVGSTSFTSGTAPCGSRIQVIPAITITISPAIAPFSQAGFAADDDTAATSLPPSLTETGVIPRAFICARAEARSAASTTSLFSPPEGRRYEIVNAAMLFVSNATVYQKYWADYFE